MSGFDDRQRAADAAAAYRAEREREQAPVLALDALRRIEERLATLITLQQTTNQLLQRLADRPPPAGG